MDVLFDLLELGFVTAQGAAVFITAFVVLRVLRNSHWLAKLAAMIFSYSVWIALTLWGYFALGGDGSFMKGFAIVLLLCATALVSSTIYLMGWLFWPCLSKIGRPVSAPAG